VVARLSVTDFAVAALRSPVPAFAGAREFRVARRSFCL
jgi:hypothetical protein